MKKTLLYSAVLLAAGSAFAAVPTMQKADRTLINMGPKAPAMAPSPKAATRAGGAETFDFTYAQYASNQFNVNDWTEVTPGLTRIYMGFEMSVEDIKAFAGSKVTGFNIYSPTNSNNTGNSIKSGRLFYSTDPYLSKLDYTQDFDFSAQSYGMNKVTLNDSYTITGNEDCLVFGYSLVAQANMYYVPITNLPTYPSAGILGLSENGNTIPTQWLPFGDFYGALCLSVTLEGEGYPRELFFESFPETLSLPLGKKTEVPITISTVCGEPIESVDIEYTIGGDPVTSTYVYEPPVPGSMNGFVGAMLDFPAQSADCIEEVEFRLTKLNGKPLTNTSPAKAMIRVMDKVPVHQTLMEEYTGTWCGWCTRGFAALEYIRENHPEFVVAAFHQGNDTKEDPMQVTDLFPDAASTLPSSMLNRMYTYDPHDGSATYDSLPVPIVGDIEVLNAVPTAWKVNVSHIWEGDSLLTVKANVSNVAGYSDRDYQIAYLLVADGLTGKGGKWAQTNYYYNESQNAGYCEQLNAFCRRGSHGLALVPGLVFNDVVISADGVYGIEGSVPSSLAPDQEVEHEFTFDLTKIRTVSSTGATPAKIPFDVNKLRVIAAVLDGNGAVMNCAKDEVNDHHDAAVSGIDASDAPVEYFNLNGMKVAQPAEGVFIRRQGGKAEKVFVR